MKRAPKLLWVIPGVLLWAGFLKATLPQTATGTWTSAVSLSQPRSNASAVMLSDGRLLITGGDDSSGPLQSTETFATDGTTASAAAMNVARSRHFTVTLSDGRVLVGGGGVSAGGTTNSAELYDPSMDSWTQTSPMTSARANATAALLQDGRVLIAGGDNAGNPSNTIEIYDPSTLTFSFAGTLSSPRTRHAMAVLSDGRVLIVGGSDGTNTLASSDIFDPSSGNISAGPSLATARYGHSATTLLDGTVFIAGGATSGSNGTIELASAELFDPSTGTLSTASTNLVTARQGHQAFLLPNNNNVLIVGGTSGGQPIATSELFSPWQGTFAATGANVTSRSAAVGSAIKQDGLLLAAGGSDASGNTLASTELYAFPIVKTDASDYAPGSIVTITGSGWRAGETVTLTLVESPLIDTHPVMTAIADGNGNISNNQFSPDVHDINVRFYLTAVGSQSGLQAQNTFTDAAGDNTSTTVSCSPNPVTVNTATTCTATVNNTATPVTNGHPQGDVTFSFNGTGTFSPASAQCTVAQIGATNNSSCSVTLTPTAVVSGNVKGNFNSADSGSWKNSVSPNFPLTVNAPTCTAPSISTQPSSQTITYGQNAIFTSAASGTPAPTVQWQVSTNSGSTWTNLTNGGVVGGATTGTLTLTAAPVSLSTNRYRAVFTNTCNGTQTANSNPATLTVNPKALTVTGIAVTDHVYDAGTTATLNFGSAALQGIVSPDVVTLNTSGYTATFASKNVANGIAVTVTGLGLNGAQAANYTLTQPTGLTGNITAVTLTASITGNPTKPYDGNTSATLTSANLSLSGLVTGESITVTQTAGTYNSKDVVTAATVSATLSAGDFTAGAGTLLTNYVLPSTASGAGQITPKVLTASIIGNPTKTYDGNTNATLTSTNFSLTGLVTGESFTVTKFSGTYNSKDVVTVTTITASLSASDFTAASGTLASNYTVPTTASGPGQITPKTLTASIVGNPSKTYDGTTSATLTPANFSLSGLISGESFTVTKGTGNYNSKDVTSAITVTVSLTAGDFMLGSGTLAGNYTLPTTASGPGQITARPLTVSAHGVDKQYDGTTVATVTLSDDRIAGDIFTDTDTSASFVDKNVGPGKSVSVIGIAISGVDTSNYALQNTTASTTANITTRPLTVSATGINKVYDGTTTATVNLADDRITGDVFTDSYTGAAFNTKNLGNGKPVRVSGISISGTDAGNYILSNTTANTMTDVSARPLTIAATGVNRMYDGTVTATVTLADNRVSGDVFTDNYASASFTDKTVGTAKAVSVNGISISGADAGNYTFNSTAATTADITARPLTVGATGVNKVYDGTTAAAVTLSDNRISGDMLTESYASANFTDKNVANGKPVSVTGISISGLDASNYALQNTTANTTANITTRPLTVTAAGVNKEYDGTTAATVTLADDRVSGDTLTTSYTSAAFADKGVANGKPVSVSGISISGADAGNYASQNSTANTTADISPRPLTISAHGVDKQYDSTTTATVTLTDDRLAGDVFNDTYTTATFADKNVDNGKTVSVTGISISGADAGNYTFNTTASVNANITHRPITISAHGVDKQYDGTTTATVTLTDDRLAGDVLSDGYASATFADKNVGNGKAVSVNGISISGADAGNYAPQNTTASANANVTPRPLTVNATGVNKQYDGNVNATVTLSDDRVVGDGLTDSYISASFADKSVGNGKPVSVSGISISGSDVGNYALLNTTASTAANISLRSLTITAHGVDKQYDGTTSATVTLSDDRIAGDSFTDNYTSAGFIDKNAVSGKTVGVTGISISGTDAGNYTFNPTASTTASINPRPITVTAVTDTKVYDGTTSSAGVPTVSAPGIATGDAANFSQAFDTKNAGPRILKPSGSVTDGNSGNNYSVTFMTASGTISQRPITATANAQTKVYGGVDPLLTYQISGGPLVVGDSFSGALTRAAGENVGPYAIQQGTLTAGNNYALTYVGANLTITRASLTITPDGGKTKIVGSVFTAFTGVVSGLKFSDAVTVTYTSTGTPASAGAGTYDITVASYNFTVGMASNYTITQNTAANGLHVLYSTASCLGDYGHQILQPINFDGTSVFKQKSTVPAKFRVCDINGNSIGLAGVVSSFRLVQTMAGTVVSAVDESVDSTTPDAAFRWDPTAQQWIFNMNTKSLMANVTYYYTITLNDNSTITFMFGLK